MLPWEGIFIVYMTWQWHRTKKDNFYPASRNLQYVKPNLIPILLTIKIQFLNNFAINLTSIELHVEVYVKLFDYNFEINEKL